LRVLTVYIYRIVMIQK